MPCRLLDLIRYSYRLRTEVAERTRALRQSEATQQIILNAIPDLLIRYSGDGILLNLMNSGDVPLLAPEAVMLGKHLFEFLPSPMAEERLYYIRRALETGQMQVHEYQFQQRESIRYEESRIVPSGDNEVLIIVRDVTERKQAENALKESQVLYQSLTEVLPHCLYRTDLRGRLTFVNPAFLKTLGQSLEDCLGKVYDFYPAELADKYTLDNQRVLATGSTLRTIEIHQIPESQKRIYVEVIKSPVYAADGHIIGLQGVFWDITDLQQAQEELTAQKQFLQQVIDNMPSATFVKDCAGRLLSVNKAMALMHGQKPENMIGKFETEFNPNITPADLAISQKMNQQVIDRRITLQEEQAIKNVRGETRWYQTIISPFLNANNEVQGIIGNCIDITERKTMEAALQAANAALERLATFDSLTKIPNRRRFDEYLQQEWQRLAREEQPLSLILLDVDFFKIFNDHLGHQQGDECLIAVAQAMSRAVKRSADLVARYGGEEFAVILPNTRRVGAVMVAEAIQAEIATLKIAHPNSPINDLVTASMGIASTVPNDSKSPSELIAVADASLYQAKRRGRNRYWVRLL